MINRNLENDAKMAALNYAKLSELPAEYKKNNSKIWIKAIVRVLKNNGRYSYCLAENHYDDIRIIKDFGASYGIVSIDAIYPIKYLDSAQMPDLRKQSDCVFYLVKHGEDENSMKQLLAKEKEDGTPKTKEELADDKQKIKNMILKYASEDAMSVSIENERINNMVNTYNDAKRRAEEEYKRQNQ